MKEVWKFQLGDGMDQNIKMPMHSTVIAVQVQHDHACLWVLVQPENVQEYRRFHIVGTGHAVPESARKYIGTIQQGLFVWHIFEGDNG